MSIMETKLAEFAALGHIVPRTENNPYLKVSYKGAGGLVSDKWNVKIYTSGSVVCNDKKFLQDIVDGKVRPPDETLKIIQIDDAGIGFPICGVMLGVSDGARLWTETVDVEFFQGEKFSSQQYVKEYTRRGIALLGRLSIKPETHRIEICTGFINQNLRDELRKGGFDVRVTEIKGVLQDRLEFCYREYVKFLADKDLAYDPKEVEKNQLGKRYYQVVNWAKRFKPDLLKSGWKSLS